MPTRLYVCQRAGKANKTRIGKAGPGNVQSATESEDAVGPVHQLPERNQSGKKTEQSHKGKGENTAGKNPMTIPVQENVAG